MERGFGKSEGLTKDEILALKEKHGQIYDVWNYNANTGFNDIEKMQDFCARIYDFLDDVTEKYKDKNNFYFLSTKGAKVYSDVKFRDGDFLVFGKESHGLPEPLLKEHYDNTLRIPMWQNLKDIRRHALRKIILSKKSSLIIWKYRFLRKTDRNLKNF